MICNPLDTVNPFLWIFVAGLFIGLGLGGLPFSFPRGHERRRPFSRAWTFPALFFSVGVFSFSAALYASRGGLFSENPVSLEFLSRPAWILLFLISVLPGWLSFRFPRGAGIPVLLLLCFLAAGSSLALRSWTCGDYGTEILSLKVLLEKKEPGSSDWKSVVQFDFADGSSLLATLEGREILPVVEQIDPPEFLFFLGKAPLYRIPAVQGAEVASRYVSGEGPGGEIPIEMPGKRFPAWGNLLARIAEKSPIMKYRRDTPAGPVSGIGRQIRVFLDRDAGATMEPVFF